MLKHLVDVIDLLVNIMLIPSMNTFDFGIAPLIGTGKESRIAAVYSRIFQWSNLECQKPYLNRFHHICIMKTAKRHWKFRYLKQGTRMQ